MLGLGAVWPAAEFIRNGWLSVSRAQAGNAEPPDQMGRTNAVSSRLGGPERHPGHLVDDIDLEIAGVMERVS